MITFKNCVFGILLLSVPLWQSEAALNSALTMVCLLKSGNVEGFQLMSVPGYHAAWFWGVRAVVPCVLEKVTLLSNRLQRSCCLGRPKLIFTSAFPPALVPRLARKKGNREKRNPKFFFAPKVRKFWGVSATFDSSIAISATFHFSI